MNSATPAKFDFEFLRGHDLVVYSADWCPDCDGLKHFLDAQGVAYRELSIDDDASAAEKLERETGKRGVPFILIDGATWVRGYHKEARARLVPGVLVAELRSAVGA